MKSNFTVLALDLGTTSTKGLLVDPNGQTLAQASRQHPLTATLDGVAEQNPKQHLEAAFAVITELVRGKPASCEIAAISLSAPMHNLVLLDAHKEPISATITWADRRAGGEAKSLRSSSFGQALYQRTGTPIHAMAWPAKLAYLKARQPRLFEQAAYFVGIKELLLFHLTGELVCDHSIASATGIFRLDALAWDKEALSFLQIDVKQLPLLDETTRVLKLTSSASARLGLDAETQVVLGASDGCLSNLGAGAISPGCAAITIGTSGAVRSVVPNIRIDEKMRTFCYVLTKAHFVVGGAVNGGGVALQWAKDQLFADQRDTPDDDAYGELIRQASQIDAGCDGLLFHPYLTGERAPIYNSDARASFIGLSLAHTRAHMLRAVMEGILLNLEAVLSALETVAGPQEKIVAVGGFSRSAVWRQMMSDVFDRQIEFPADIESSALGAARLAFFALGEAPLLEAFATPPQVNDVYRPRRVQADTYAELKPVFASVTMQLGDVYTSLAKDDLAVPRGAL